MGDLGHQVILWGCKHQQHKDPELVIAFQRSGACEPVCSGLRSLVVAVCTVHTSSAHTYIVVGL